MRDRVRVDVLQFLVGNSDPSLSGLTTRIAADARRGPPTRSLVEHETLDAHAAAEIEGERRRELPPGEPLTVDRLADARARSRGGA